MGLRNGGIFDNNVPKRLWVEGTYARFVRPGDQRVSTSGSVPSGVLLTAFKNTAHRTVVVVAANTNSSPSSLSVFISGAAPCGMTPWVTSATDSLAGKPAVSVSGARFS